MAQASGEKLELIGPAKKERVVSVHKESSWQIRRSRLGQNEKEQSRPSRIPDYGWGKKVNVGKKEEDQSKSTEWSQGDS